MSGLGRRGLVVVAVVVGLAPLAACGPEHDGRPSFASAPCPTPNIAGVPPLELGPGFECGYLTVPEDRSKVNGPTIRIAVARAKATSPDPKPDPIVYLAGGPGGTGLATAALRVHDGWNADRDVIFLDQRGTLHSDPLLGCSEIDEFFQHAVSLAPTAAATREQGVAATRACHDRLVNVGRDLAAYNSTENAADVADLRVALGIDEWNVYGVSYGTDLALQLLRDHPEGIRSMVLDSLVPPQLNLIEAFWPNAAQGYQALFDACAAEAACHAAYPELPTEFTSLVQQLTDEPRSITVTDPSTGQPVTTVFDGYTLANLVVVAALVPGSIAKVPSLVHQLATGDGSEAALALLATRPPTGLTGYGLAYGVFCREQVAFTTSERVAARAKAALPAFPDAVLSLVPQLPNAFDDCGRWSVPPADPAVTEQTFSDLPVLLLEGSLDGITPLPLAEAAASGLANSHTLVFPGAGHDVMIWSPACAVTVMGNFLDHPQAFDDSCLASVQAPPFEVHLD